MDLTRHLDQLTLQSTDIEFVPRRFLRCHSKTDKDSADISTQVNWSLIITVGIVCPIHKTIYDLIFKSIIGLAGRV